MQREYGPAPGMESIEERRLRELREAEERERKLREIEELRKGKVRSVVYVLHKGIILV